jgi:DNA-binding response OmpR family regulator
LLLVEDECRFSSALQEGLRDAHHRVDVASDGEEGLNLARRSTYDVLLLDIVLPGPDGIEICRHLRSLGDRTPILLLTARDNSGDRLRGLDAGADDYLVKPFGFSDLLARIERLIRRRMVASEGILQVGDLTLHPDVQRVEWAGRRIGLTVREYKILETLMRRSGSMVSRDTIITSVWGVDFPHTSNLVEVYVRRLCRKLADAGAASLIQSQGVGYRLGPPATQHLA